jgi:putative transcriptional regulator
VPRFTTVPGVLIAVPQLMDGHFDRAVVVMVEHDDDGALGLVINHQIDRECGAVVEAFDLPWHGAAGDRLRRGGPVEPASLWMLHDDGWCFDETMRVSPGVSVSRSQEAITRMCLAGEARLRLLVGYAGWGAGQLETEIQAGSWIVGPMSPELVFEWPPREVWARSLAHMGIDPAFLVESTGRAQ